MDNVKFAVQGIKEIESKDYPNDEYAIVEMNYLGSNPNSHELIISNDVLRRDAKTALGKWIVADVTSGVDCGTHTDNQTIVGMIPANQSVRFEEIDGGYIRAYATGVISKIYAKQFCKFFSEADDSRSVSVEMAVGVEEDEHTVKELNIVGVTVLGHAIRPSSPGSDITFTRFSEKDAENYYNSVQTNLSDLEKFVEDKKKAMAEKYASHPINTSKEAIYEGEWAGDKAKQDLVKEKNYKTLAPKVCLRLEPGWEDREVSKLGYPVMGLYDGEWRYSAKALASAQAYAEKENETEVLKTIKKIKKKLGLDDSDGKEETKMAEQETEKVEMEAVEAEKEAPVENTVSEPEKAEMAEPEIKCEETPAEKEHKHENEPEHEDFEAKCAQLTKDIEERDNIIMVKDAKIGEYEKELADLREYKRCVEASQLACKVEEVLSSVEKFANDEQMSTFREEGKKCTLETIAAFENKVKAICFENVKKKKSKEDDMIKMSINLPKTETESGDIWTRLENKYNK